MSSSATAMDVDKRSKEERKADKKRKRQQQEEEEEAAAQAAQAEADRKAAKKAKKEAKRKAAEEAEEAEASTAAASAAASAARTAEVLEAGAAALREEAEEDAQAEAERKAAKKAKKEAKRKAEAEVAAAAGGAEVKEGGEEDAEKQRRKREKKEKKEKAAREAEAAAAASSSPSSSSSAAAAAAAASSSSAATAGADGAAAPPAKVYPPLPPQDTSLLLFYQYVRPSWTASQRQAAEDFARDSLTRHGCTGRLRCAYEGFNSTLTGPAKGIRAFCEDLRQYEPQHFANTDFKIVDGLRDSQRLRGLKVWHVTELVTYGFERGALKGAGAIEQGGTHLPPQEWHDKAAEDNTVLIDVRNANENALGRFQPLNDAARVLDPYMRVSTEFPEWIDKNLHKLKAAKQVMMYCTGGIRCERASALLVQRGLPADRVFQLEGGIHRYLEAFPDGGHWIGKNYTFDRRFAHGATAKEPEVVGRCCVCSSPWDRYQAAKKCALCRMEVLVCRECERSGKMKTVQLKCHLCGGPKPSYLLPDENCIRFKKKNAKFEKAGSADY